MKRIRILAIKLALMLILFCNSTAIVAAITSKLSGQIRRDILSSSQNGYSIDVVLSKYVEQQLSIMRYDSSSFRFLIFIEISKRGKVKYIRLLNQGSFENNMIAWTETKRIIKRIHFIPARLNDRAIVYHSTFYLRLDFTMGGD